MKLTKQQSEQLVRDRGIWITEACDKCGKLLGEFPPIGPENRSFRCSS